MASKRIIPASSKTLSISSFPAKANCFSLSLKRSLTFYQYDVSIVPELNVMRCRRDLLKRLIWSDFSSDFKDANASYDGRAIIYTLRDLNYTSRSYVISESDDSSRNRRSFQVTLKKVGCVSSKPFETQLAFEQRPSPITTEAITFIQALNLLLRNYFNTDIFRLGPKTVVFNGTVKDIGSGLELRQGCVASIRPSFNNALLNVDMTSLIMYKKTDLITLAMLLLECENVRELDNPINILKLDTLLKNLRVRQVKSGKVGRVCTIKKIVRNAGDVIFECNGKYLKVADYFREMGCNLKLIPKQPGIEIERVNSITGVKEASIIPFQLLEVVEDQIYRRRLDPITRERVQKLTSASPVERKRLTLNFLENLDQGGLSKIGLDIYDNLLSVNGKVLPPPEIKFQNKGVCPVEGKWGLGGMYEEPLTKVFEPCGLRMWAILSYEPKLGFSSIKKDTPGRIFLSRLIMCMKRLGVGLQNYKDLERPIVVREENPQGSVYEHAKDILSSVWKEYRHLKLNYDQFILLVFLPAHGTSVHEQLKEVGDTKAISGSPGFSTQCIDSTKALNLKLPDSYFRNITLKINAKLGGVNFVAKGNGMELLDRSPVLIAGADVSHPRQGTYRPSVAGFVASVDRNACRYVADISSQAARLEEIEHLRPMFAKSLRLFRDYPHRKKRQLPERIIFYRDGLSEGEFYPVTDREIDAIKGAIEEVWSDPESEIATTISAAEVRLTYIIVVKRHHIRFFPDTTNRVGKSGNCPSGFLADGKEIRNPLINSFYLLSHEGILGTSRPSHYIIIRNECKHSNLELQQLSFGLCHVFSRCTRAISLPAPVAYAHLVCQRADIHLRRNDGDPNAEPPKEEHEEEESDWVFSPFQAWQEKFMCFI